MKKRNYDFSAIKVRSYDTYPTWFVSYDGTVIGKVEVDRRSYTNNLEYDAAFSFKNYEKWLSGNFKTLYAAKVAIIKAFEQFEEEHPDCLMDEKSTIDIKELPQGDNSEFYPTPNSLIGKMLKGIKWSDIYTVLEPEAGKGDLIKAVIKANSKARSSYSRELEIDCIEKDVYLQHILRGEGYRVIHDDFLTYNGKKRYDLIIMNPPFSNADEHLLKALEVQKNGGAIICLLNAETLKNPYTKRRQYLARRLEEVNAQIFFFEHEFKKAERQSDVEVALVKVYIPYDPGTSTIWEKLHKSNKTYEEEFNESKELAPAEFIDFIIRQYNIEIEASLELIREYQALKPYILDSFNGDYKSPILQLTVGSHSSSLDINEYMRMVRAKYWKALLSNKEFTGKLTSNLHDKYMDMVRELADYDFTEFNIKRIYAEINSEIVKGIKESIIGIFDKLSAEHTWFPECEKNIHYYSGWKTNKAHKIGQKVILPVNGMFADYTWSKTFEVNVLNSVLSDIEKVFNYLDGNMNAECWVYNALDAACRRGQTKNIECKYFKVTIYKKGTAHITFREEYVYLVDALNIYAAKNKSWLPPCYGKTTYEDMTEEEQKVIDEFQSKMEYDNILQHKEKYLFEVPEQLLLTKR